MRTSNCEANCGGNRILPEVGDSLPHHVVLNRGPSQSMFNLATASLDQNGVYI